VTRNPWPDISHSAGQDLASQSLACGSFSTALAHMGSMKFVFAWGKSFKFAVLKSGCR
jgi:hypothetical protein